MSQVKDVQIHDSWKRILKNEFEQPYFATIKQSIVNDKKAGYKVYPPGPLIFNAFNSTPFDEVKVVIIGQDPYHGHGQAHGLSFSVPDGVPPPPSLENIFKELHTDIGMSIPSHGNLQKWADQGVLLLNAGLTVRAHTPNSHKDIGWHQFTDAVIQKLSDYRKGIVFLLWGNFAKGKSKLIDELEHYILKTGHPSPMSANRGYWFGNKHFSQANELLVKQDLTPIDWTL